MWAYSGCITIEVAEPEVNEVCENEVNQLVESPFEIVHDNSSCQEAIQGRIAELERLQEATARKLALARKRYLKSEEEKEEIKKRLKGLFNDDQMRSMERLSAQGARWEAGTLVKSLQLRLACGSRGYGLLREFGYPLPSDRTLQRHIQHVKFRPGLLRDILEPLRAKVWLG
ncbi:hypothetical protein HPB51_013120 [Rhipicephalus microplus]|uniref:Uncharacterized protein n=1 Tax=Rhipicephalus microplus TaxID=6941 RepID=A0A9J6F297_RHIMP|nr:hypothetical protein HPB51_013120 [Rhipicephalus microplus]